MNQIKIAFCHINAQLAAVQTLQTYIFTIKKVSLPLHQFSNLKVHKTIEILKPYKIFILIKSTKDSEIHEFMILQITLKVKTL